jgi:hypothetical protein
MSNFDDQRQARLSKAISEGLNDLGALVCPSGWTLLGRTPGARAEALRAALDSFRQVPLRGLSDVDGFRVALERLEAVERSPHWADAPTSPIRDEGVALLQAFAAGVWIASPCPFHGAACPPPDSLRDS